MTITEWIGLKMPVYKSMEDAIRDLYAFDKKELAKRLKNGISTVLKTGMADGEPLKQTTIKAKGHNIKLYHGGDLADNVRVKILKDSISVGFDDSQHESVQGGKITRADLALVHNEGRMTMHGNNKLPRRNFLTNNNLNEWHKRFQRMADRFINSYLKSKGII